MKLQLLLTLSLFAPLAGTQKCLLPFISAISIVALAYLLLLVIKHSVTRHSDQMLPTVATSQCNTKLDVPGATMDLVRPLKLTARVRR